MLTDEQLTEVIRRGESDRVEFSESAGDLNKIRKAICAFANDLPDYRLPGYFLVGIKDDGTCAGLPIDDLLLTTLGGLRSDGKILPFPMMSVEKRAVAGGDVAVISVTPADDPPIKFDGRCWIRTGPRRGHASATEESRLIAKQTYKNPTYDRTKVSGSSVDMDLNVEQIQKEYLPAVFSAEVLAENDRLPHQQLLAMQLVTPDYIPTVASILAFGEKPQHWFPGAYIQFVRFEGVEMTDPVRTQRVIKGTLIEQMRFLELLFDAHIMHGLKIKVQEHGHELRPDYPIATLREMARNALIHRAYDIGNAPVRIYWYTDRVEIFNSGAPYGAVTPENFGDPGVVDYRNPAIAEIMNYMKFMEHFGHGFLRAKKALAKIDAPPLEYDISGNITKVIIKAKVWD